ncbi:MAG: PAS domain S-box protein [Deltaproteobacteria bacterium]|nr:PAS domain S-box protein [Deltaproteobacteria bacterium]
MRDDEFRVRISIFQKIMLYAVLLVFLAVGISTYLAVNTESKVLKEGLIHVANHTARDIASSTKSAFWSLNWIFVERMLKDSVQGRSHQVIYAKVVKPNGEVYLASDRAFYGEKVAASLLSDHEALLDNYLFPEQKERGILSVLPVTINNDTWHIIVGLSLKSVKKAMKNLVVHNLAWGSLIVLLGIGGSFFFSRSISKPLMKLAKATKKISDGDWEDNLTIKSADEVGLLSHSFYKMMKEVRAATAKLEASELRYRSLITTASRAKIGITVIQSNDNRKGLIRYVNDGIADLLGYSKKTLLKMTIQDIIHPDNYDEAWEMYTRTPAGDESAVTYQFWAINKRGEKLPIEISTAVTEFDGKRALVCYIRDVTEKLAAEQQLKDYSQNLERMVEERAAELKKTLTDLQNAQSQLIQSEKMASIGQLAAGVAHEINNPVGFVQSNLGTIAEYWEDLMKLLNQYRVLETGLAKEKNIGGDGTLRKALENIQNQRDKIDLGSILNDYKNVINESLEGMARVTKIVSDLKDFAHVDKAEIEHTDLNKGIESTLNIAWNELKYKAEVIKDFGNIPLVKCYPQRLNQVFMNLLVNAAHAIEDKGEIRITTRHDNGHVEIRISDTGCGIPPDVLTKIFDPFFTTKEVGKGTGLGLNVAYNIIQRHKGTILVESEVGKGTTFTIRLQTEPDLVE